ISLCSVSWCFLFFFFFSSRRRHTRSDRDWSSDVCSSDLVVVLFHASLRSNVLRLREQVGRATRHTMQTAGDVAREQGPNGRPVRSEERRVGKEWRSRGSAEQ